MSQVKTWQVGDPEPIGIVAVSDRFSRTWEPMADDQLPGLWRHAGEQIMWANLLTEHGPVTEVPR